jgi:hypothetical protein
MYPTGRPDVRNLPPPFDVIAQAFVDWWEELFRFVGLSVVWMLCWLTVILGPPATFGLYYVTNRIVHKEYLGLGGFVEGSRRYFVKSWLWALLNLVAFVLLLVSFVFYGQIGALWSIFPQVFIFALSITWLCAQFFALPYLMEQEEKRLGVALRNGLLTTLAAPVYSLIIVAFSGIALLLGIVLVLPIILGAPALVSALGNHAVLERLEAFGKRT